MPVSGGADPRQPVAPLTEQLAGAPTNWCRWGPDDEIGAANFLNAAQVLRGIATVRDGQVLALQVPFGNGEADPLWPGRQAAQRYQVIDHSHFAAGKHPGFPGGIEYADDVLNCAVQVTTNCDALGHAWYGDQIWNGYPAESTVGSLSRASITPLAEHGLVGRAVLLDIARQRGKSWLDRGETIQVADLERCAADQGVQLGRRDIVVLRTGWLSRFFKIGKAEFYRGFVEPGLQYTPELVSWAQERELPALVTDTMANEVTLDPQTGAALTLHGALMRNLGVVFVEMVWLEALAEACVADGRWDFLFVTSPLKLVGGTGSPVNPLAIR
jgi:kynurenine formamidase